MAGRIRDSGDDLVENHEINVTPFIDVMLVLLIIFMIAAPLATVDVAVDLPAASAAPQPRPAEPIFVTLREDLTLALGDDPVAREALGPSLEVLARGDRETRIFLRADEAGTAEDGEDGDRHAPQDGVGAGVAAEGGGDAGHDLVVGVPCQAARFQRRRGRRRVVRGLCHADDSGRGPAAAHQGSTLVLGSGSFPDPQGVACVEP